jgi:hypothetical protein
MLDNRIYLTPIGIVLLLVVTLLVARPPVQAQSDEILPGVGRDDKVLVWTGDHVFGTDLDGTCTVVGIDGEWLHLQRSSGRDTYVRVSEVECYKVLEDE